MEDAHTMVDTESFGLPECAFLAVRYAPVAIPVSRARGLSFAARDGEMSHIYRDLSLSLSRACHCVWGPPLATGL